MGKRPSGAAGMLGVFNELYNPSAHSAQIVVEEQKEAIKPNPSPMDKNKPGLKKNPTE